MIVGHRAVRFALTLGTFVAATAVSVAARAESTSLKEYVTAAPYTIGATGRIPSVKVPGVGAVVTGAGGDLPDVSPGHSVTVTILVNSSSGAPVPRGNISLSVSGTNVNVSLPITSVPIPSLAMTPVVGGKLAPTPMGIGIKYTLNIPPGQHSIYAQYTDPTGAIAPSRISGNIHSLAHSAVDVDCYCRAPNGVTTRTCVQSGKPTSPGHKLVCTSNVVAETVSPGATVAAWAAPPAGRVDINVEQIGTMAGDVIIAQPWSTGTIQHDTHPVPGTYSVTSTYIPSIGGIALQSAPAATSVTISPAP